jgi:hypothetical protein
MSLSSLTNWSWKPGMLVKTNSGAKYRIVDTVENHCKHGGSFKEITLKQLSTVVPIVEPEMGDPRTQEIVWQMVLDYEPDAILVKDIDSSSGGHIAIWDLESYGDDLLMKPSADVQGSGWGWRAHWAAGANVPAHQFSSREEAIKSAAMDVLQ